MSAVLRLLKNKYKKLNRYGGGMRKKKEDKKTYKKTSMRTITFHSVISLSKDRLSSGNLTDLITFFDKQEFK